MCLAWGGWLIAITTYEFNAKEHRTKIDFRFLKNAAGYNQDVHKLDYEPKNKKVIVLERAMRDDRSYGDT